MAKVLVVNSGESEFDQLQTALAESGWEVLRSTDPNEAVQLTPDIQPSVILLDPFSLDMDLQEAITSLKQSANTESIPLLLFADHRAVSLADSLNTAADLVLEKPINPDELTVAIHFLTRTERMA